MDNNSRPHSYIHLMSNPIAHFNEHLTHYQGWDVEGGLTINVDENITHISYFENEC